MDHAHPSHLLAQCPLCHTNYPAAEVRLVGEKGTTRLFHCTCTNCGHAMLAIVLEAQGSVSSLGLMTDLEAKDALRFHEREPVSADECIAAHRLFEESSKEFCHALRANGMA
ncbi:MAG: hypothetical protein ABIO72_05230 [Patescibacteria group bacterium]